MATVPERHSAGSTQAVPSGCPRMISLKSRTCCYIKSSQTHVVASCSLASTHTPVAGVSVPTPCMYDFSVSRVHGGREASKSHRRPRLSAMNGGHRGRWRRRWSAQRSQVVGRQPRPRVTPASSSAHSDPARVVPIRSRWGRVSADSSEGWTDAPHKARTMTNAEKVTWPESPEVESGACGGHSNGTMVR